MTMRCSFSSPDDHALQLFAQLRMGPLKQAVVTERLTQHAILLCKILSVLIGHQPLQLCRAWLPLFFQAHWRGHWVRLRWKVNREQLVLDERARIEAEDLHQARLQDLQHKLAIYQQKKLAQAAAEAEASADGDPRGRPALAANAGAAAAGGLLPGVSGGAGGGGVSRAASAVWRKAGAQLSAVASLRSLKSVG
jgi:hypothetical protein